MPTLMKQLVKFLRDPSLISERLVERRMTVAALQFYGQRTHEENDLERSAFFGQLADINALANEARQLPTIQQIQTTSASSDPKLKIAASQTSSLDDCITMYVTVRLWQPQVMVETGVFYGAMSAMILSAMERNGKGKLYSIDLPLEVDGLSPELRGALVEERLRSRWQLILGDSRVELPRLITKLQRIDAFNHDSLHTTRHMTWEYETAWPYISDGGFLISHDVLMTPSWERFCRAHRHEISQSGRVYSFGIARKRS